MLNGVDTGAQLSTSSKLGIDTVVYFATQPNHTNPKDFISAVKYIVKVNEVLSTLLDCKTLPPARYCLKLGNILGVPQSAIVAGFSSHYGKASNLSLDTNRFTQGNTIVTSTTGRINITLPKHA